MPDYVYITCYSRTERRDRQDAIRFYERGMRECDPNSSECSRYARIVRQLRMGLTTVTGD